MKSINTIKRMREITRKIRQHAATQAEIQELAKLESAFYAPTPPAKTIFDLPIAARMWREDARELNA